MRISDWSSDVCSSDLLNGRAIAARRQTMTFPIIYALARNCVVSPLNVRTESDPDADAELEAMIGQAGFIIQNLIGTAVKRKKDQYSIFGGGRRLTRVHALIEKGELPRSEERRGGKGGVSTCRSRWSPYH